MKILLLSHHDSLHFLIQQLLLVHAPHAQIWRTHALASALPYLRQEPDIEAVVLDVALCGWSRLATLVNTLKPCLAHRRLILLVETPPDVDLVRALGVTADYCLPKTGGIAPVVEKLFDVGKPAPPASASRESGLLQIALTHPASGAGSFTTLAW